MQNPFLSFLISLALKFTLSDGRIAVPACLQFLFAWQLVFHSLALSFGVSQLAKCVSWRQCIVSSCFLFFFFQSLSLHLFIGELGPFTFKVTIEKRLQLSINLLGDVLFLLNLQYFFSLSVLVLGVVVFKSCFGHVCFFPESSHLLFSWSVCVFYVLTGRRPPFFFL